MKPEASSSPVSAAPRGACPARHGHRCRWALALLLVISVLLVNLLRLSEFRAQWRSHSPSVVESTLPATICPTMDVTHRDPLFVAHAQCLSQPQIVSVLRELVFEAARLFETHNITYFLDSSTLLGAFRNASVIEYDSDADVAIDEAGFEYLRSRRVEVPEPFFLAVYASGDLYPLSQRDKGIPVRMVHKPTALYVDVFVFQAHEPTNATAEALVGPYPSWAFDKCVQCTEYYSQGKQLLVPRDWIFPTVDCAFEGRTLKCPREAEKYLRYMFGDDFRTPIQY